MKLICITSSQVERGLTVCPDITRKKCTIKIDVILRKHHLMQMCLPSPSGQLDNYTMTGTRTAYGEGNSVGSNFHWDSDQNSLKPHKEGIYFVYINLSLTCTSSTCRAGLLRLTMDDKLTCEVELTSNKTSESKKCWTVKPLHGQRLNIQMNVLKDKLENWKLDLPNSGFGIFLVD